MQSLFLPCAFPTDINIVYIVVNNKNDSFFILLNCPITFSFPFISVHLTGTSLGTK